MTARPKEDYINQAKQLVDENAAPATGWITDRGGTIGPDLTYVGDKAPEQYDYSRMLGVKTASPGTWSIYKPKIAAGNRSANSGFTAAMRRH